LNAFRQSDKFLFPISQQRSSGACRVHEEGKAQATLPGLYHLSKTKNNGQGKKCSLANPPETSWIVEVPPGLDPYYQRDIDEAVFYVEKQAWD